ncbi:MAG: threonine/serine dehydratase [Myxococcales bacterium]|nr:threonine/serine dehydratase [Myxococcales bacterium]
MLSDLSVSLDDVRAAATRIAPHVRRTPSLPWTCRIASVGPVLDRRRVTLKLEHLQVGGSFKARGAVNRLALAGPDALARGVITASGGNHGLGVAWAASRFGARASVFLPERAPASTERRLQAMGAETVRRGAAWDDAWRLAEQAAVESGGLLVHPFEDPAVIAGQGTVGLELCEDAPDLDVLFVAVGGGGLIAGAGLAAKALRPSLRLVAVEPIGAPSLSVSLDAGRVVELAEVRTIAGTLAPRAIGPTTLAFAQALVDEVVLVSDDEMRAAMRLLWDELRLLVEPAGAAALAALVSGRVKLAAAQHVGVLVCGANLDVEAILGG